jgi:hypothetical protein
LVDKIKVREINLQGVKTKRKLLREKF